MCLLMCTLRHVPTDWQAAPPAACAALCLPCVEDPVSFEDKLISFKSIYHFPSQVLEEKVSTKLTHSGTGFLKLTYFSGVTLGAHAMYL